eukprot:171922_1
MSTFNRNFKALTSGGPEMRDWIQTNARAQVQKIRGQIEELEENLKFWESVCDHIESCGDAESSSVISVRSPTWKSSDASRGKLSSLDETLKSRREKSENRRSFSSVDSDEMKAAHPPGAEDIEPTPKRDLPSRSQKSAQLPGSTAAKMHTLPKKVGRASTNIRHGLRVSIGGRGGKFATMPSRKRPGSLSPPIGLGDLLGAGKRAPPHRKSATSAPQPMEHASLRRPTGPRRSRARPSRTLSTDFTNVEISDILSKEKEDAPQKESTFKKHVPKDAELNAKSAPKGLGSIFRGAPSEPKGIGAITPRGDKFEKPARTRVRPPRPSRTGSAVSESTTEDDDRGPGSQDDPRPTSISSVSRADPPPRPSVDAPAVPNLQPQQSLADLATTTKLRKSPRPSISKARVTEAKICECGCENFKQDAFRGKGFCCVCFHTHG